MTTAALIVAAGRGTRASASGSTPKQYVMLGGMTVLRRTVSAFLSHPDVDAVAVVIHSDDQALYEQAVAGLGAQLLPAIHGGATRQESVRLGLEALAAAGHATVLIHDAARPFVSRDVIANVLAALLPVTAARLQPCPSPIL